MLVNEVVTKSRSRKMARPSRKSQSRPEVVEIEFEDMTPAQQEIARASESLEGKVMPMGLTKSEKIAWMRANIGTE
jgi:hypothetical protein